jgi:hypothetical protein
MENLLKLSAKLWTLLETNYDITIDKELLTVNESVEKHLTKR